MGSLRRPAGASGRGTRRGMAETRRRDGPGGEGCLPAPHAGAGRAGTHRRHRAIRSAGGAQLPPLSLSSLVARAAAGQYRVSASRHGPGRYHAHAHAPPPAAAHFSGPAARHEAARTGARGGDQDGRAALRVGSHRLGLLAPRPAEGARGRKERKKGKGGRRPREGGKRGECTERDKRNKRREDEERNERERRKGSKGSKRSKRSRRSRRSKKLVRAASGPLCGAGALRGGVLHRLARRRGAQSSSRRGGARVATRRRPPASGRAVAGRPPRRGRDPGAETGGGRAGRCANAVSPGRGPDAAEEAWRGKADLRAHGAAGSSADLRPSSTGHAGPGGGPARRCDAASRQRPRRAGERRRDHGGHRRRVCYDRENGVCA